MAVATLTVYPGLDSDGESLEVLADDGVTVIPPSGAIVAFVQYYTDLLFAGQLLTYDPLEAGGTPIDMVIPTVHVVGGPASAGQALVALSPTMAEFQDADLGATNGVLVSELSGIPITAYNDGAVRFCIDGGMFYAVYGDASAVIPGINIAATGGRWKRILNSSKCVVVTDLFTRTGAYHNEEVFCVGWYSTSNPIVGMSYQGDNGGGRFRWDDDCPEVGDGGYIVRPGDIVTGGIYVSAPATPGAWCRIIENAGVVRAKWFGLRGAGANPGGIWRNDSSALAAAGARVRSYGELVIPESNCWITETFKTNPALAGYTIRCEGAVIFYWAGPTLEPGGPSPGAVPYTGSTVLQLNGASHRVIGLRIAVVAGYHADFGINIGYAPGETVGPNTGAQVIDCDIAGVSATYEAGDLKFGIALDGHQRQMGNCENVFIIRTAIAKCTTANILVQYQCQPYNTHVFQCSLAGFLHTIPDGPYGIGILNYSSSLTLDVSNCYMQRLGCWVYMAQYPMSITLTQCDGEQGKRVFYMPGGGANQSLANISMRGSRVEFAGAVGQASEGGLDIFPIENGTTEGTVIEINGTATLRLDSVNFRCSYDGVPPTQIKVRDNAIHSTGCHYGLKNPFIRTGTYAAGVSQKTFSEGDYCQESDGMGGWKQVDMPTLSGAANGSGTAVVTGAATSVDIDFTTIGGVDELVADYLVEVTVVGATGVLGWPRVFDTEKLTTGFKIRLSAAPGGSDTTTVRWRCFR